MPANLLEINAKRVSIFSGIELPPAFNSRQSKQLPEDKYCFNYILFFFYGLSNVLSFYFFLNANDFWMYKFRDVSQSTYNATNKTDLQIYFASATGISQSIPGALATICIALYSQKLSFKIRVHGSQAMCLLMFVAVTLSVLLNTDSWQLEFFFLTLFVYMILTVAALFFQAYLMSIVSKFPSGYSRALMMGSGSAGLFSAIVQIIALAIADGSTETAALIFFTTGTIVILIALILSIVANYSEYHTFYLGNAGRDTKRKVYTRKEIWEATKKTWSCNVIYCVSFLAAMAGHPNITCLVVSEYYDNGSEWNRKYFVPVVTFLSTEIFSQVARLFAAPIINRKNQRLITTAFIIRSVFTSPIFFFCRTSPKKYSPLWFPHDWQYILILALTTSSGSYFSAISFLSIPRLAEDQQELAFILLQTYSNLVEFITDPLGAIFLKFL